MKSWFPALTATAAAIGLAASALEITSAARGVWAKWRAPEAVEAVERVETGTKSGEFGGRDEGKMADGGSKRRETENDATAGVRRAVLIGVDDYAEFPDLRFADADVELIRGRLIELGFAPENIVVLTTRTGRENAACAPTQRNIERELRRAIDAAGPNDSLFVMCTGHGLQTESFDGFAPYVAFAPSDAIADERTVVDFASTVSLSKLFEDLNACGAKFKWALIDACRENLSAGTKTLGAAKRLGPLNAPPGVVVMQSCADDGVSYEDEKLGHSLFTYYFAESLSEVGDENGDGVVTLLEAFSRARKLTSAHTSGPGYARPQTPYCRGDFTDFPLANVKTAEAKALYEAAVTAREAGDYEAALRDIEAALELAPKKAEYQTERSAITALAEMKRKVDAAESSVAVAADETAESVGAEAADETAESSDAVASDDAAESSVAVAESVGAEAADETAESSDAVAVPGVASTAPVEDDWTGNFAAGTLKTLEINGLTYRFRYCPPGEFLMGNPKFEAEPWENETQHRAILTQGFWLLETELTQAMWESATGDNPMKIHNAALQGPNKPAAEIDWFDCLDFVERLNAAGCAPKGLVFRLPTETEWEYACRAGTPEAADGENWEATSWYEGNASDGCRDVAQKEPNAWGLFDMRGNVCEWCWDAFEEYGPEPKTNSTGPEDGLFRVMRGGSWSDEPKWLASWSRNYVQKTCKNRYIGLRLVVGRKIAAMEAPQPRPEREAE